MIEGKGFATPSWFPVGSGPARGIVCERTGRWAVALRREPGAAGLRIHEVRTLADGWDLLGRHPSSFVVAELTAANLDSLVERMARLGRDFPWARVAVVADRSLAECEVLMREAGAVWFTTSPRDLACVAAIARRHLDVAPKPQRGLAEETWAALPWARAE